MHKNLIKSRCKREHSRAIYAGSQSVGEVRNQQLSHSLMTGLQMDEHIARIALNQGATPQVKTYLTDALGSVIATAKADQSLEVGYAFSPYGQTQKVGFENQQPGSENSSQFTGRENDNNGLYFYRARYYDPILKRFISEDPIGLAGGINSYAYVEGDPVSFVDPTGLITASCIATSTSGNGYDKRGKTCEYTCTTKNRKEFIITGSSKTSRQGDICHGVDVKTTSNLRGDLVDMPEPPKYFTVNTSNPFSKYLVYGEAMCNAIDQK